MLSKEELALLDNYRTFIVLERKRLANNKKAKPIKLPFVS
jgi:hypothetical protein